jgi:hypothetical protein
VLVRNQLGLKKLSKRDITKSKATKAELLIILQATCDHPHNKAMKIFFSSLVKRFGL